MKPLDGSIRREFIRGSTDLINPNDLAESSHQSVFELFTLIAKDLYRSSETWKHLLNQARTDNSGFLVRNLERFGEFRKMINIRQNIIRDLGCLPVNRFQFVPTARPLLGPVMRSGTAVRLDDNHSIRSNADKTDKRRLSTFSRTLGAEMILCLPNAKVSPVKPV